MMMNKLRNELKYVENIGFNLIKVINLLDNNLYLYEEYDIDSIKLKNKNLFGIFLSFTSEDFHSCILKMEKMYIDEDLNKVCFLYEYLPFNLENLVFSKLLVTQQKKYIIYNIISLLSFFSEEKSVLKIFCPQNIFISKYCNIKIKTIKNPHLFNFNFLNDQVYERNEKFSLDLTTNEYFYMAPELLLGGKITPTTDIWSLGVIMLELFSEEPVFRSESLIEYLEKIINFTEKPEKELLVRMKIPKINQDIFEMINPIDKISFLNQKDILLNKVENLEIRNLIKKMIKFDPNERISISEIIMNQYFKEFEKNDKILKGKYLVKKVHEVILNKNLFIYDSGKMSLDDIHEDKNEENAYFEQLNNTKLTDFIYDCIKSEKYKLNRMTFLGSLQSFLIETINMEEK